MLSTILIIILILLLIGALPTWPYIRLGLLPGRRSRAYTRDRDHSGVAGTNLSSRCA